MKYWMITGICLLMIALTACAASGGNGPATGGSSQPDPESSADLDAETPAEEPDEPAELPVPPIADAAQYRGVITAVEEENGDTILILRQVEGTDFGHEELRVVINESTDKEDAELAQGQYVQVFYGGQPDDNGGVNAINLVQLPDAELCIFNGTLIEWSPEEDGTGSMLLEAEDGAQTLFHFGEETQFYLDRDALQEGDLLNVYSDGTSTRSMPPQANALEVRPYR